MTVTHGLSNLPALSHWDLLLIVAVTLQATLLAYLPHPRWKALLLSLPIPFSLASLSLGQHVGSSNVLGLLLLLGYTYGVYALHVKARLPVVLSIIFCAAGYCGLAFGLARHLSPSSGQFWTAAALVSLAGVLLFRVMPWRDEPTYRTPLPVYVKGPLVALVILFMVVIKQQLQGFMTVFPMVGVIASYEGRHCLWTLTRQVPVLMFTLPPMMMVIHLIQPLVGLGWALAGGWAVFLVILTVFTRRQWSTEAAVSACRSEIGQA